MNYLGQLVNSSDSSLSEPICVFLGFTNAKREQAHLLAKVGGEWKEILSSQSLSFVRVPDKKSPTGQSIYNGPFQKKGIFNHFKMKAPSIKEVEVEITKINKLCKK